MTTTNSHRPPRCPAVGLLLLLPLAACGGNDATGSGPGSSDPARPTASAPTLPQGDDPVELDPADFQPGSDHPYFPLTPGTQWTYRETDGEGAVADVVVTVTSETRKIANGIEARVVRDTVSEDGQVTEDTFDWYAQDGDGNVWYLGEETAEFEDGTVSSREGSFEAGVDGALPGIIMPADPSAGMAYRQEYYPGQAEDNGAILADGQQVEVAQGHFDDVLLSADSSALEPDVLEYKLYAPDVGLALTLDVSGGSGREELLSTRQISGAAARAAGTAPLGTPYE
jgi:hypothetical protein